MHKRKLPSNSQWHSQATMDRQRTPTTGLSVWWHCALMSGWEPIVAEQLALAAHVGLPEINVCFLGSDAEIAQVLKSSPVRLTERFRSPDFRQYETPTLQTLWDCARRDPDAAYLYFHTKGVSAPGDPDKAAWRRLMGRAVVADWRENLRQLEQCDAVGVNLCRYRGHHYYEGNFWMARGDWIAHLPEPKQHRDGSRPGWMRPARIHAEAWVLGKSYHIARSLVCEGTPLWSPGTAQRLLHGLL